MGDGDGGRCKTSERDGRYASELVVCILREVDSANAYVVELGDAVDRKDRQRIAELKTDLNAAWKNADAAIVKLEKLSGKCETVARAALAQSRASARGVSAELWKLVISGTGKSEITANE